MVKGVLGVFVDDWPLGVEREDLQCRAKCVEEDGEKEQGAARVERVGRGF